MNAMRLIDYSTEIHLIVSLLLIVVAFAMLRTFSLLDTFLGKRRASKQPEQGSARMTQEAALASA